MKASAVIAERLRSLGFELREPWLPVRASYSGSQRTAGACMWSCRVWKDGVARELLAWNTMRECVRAPVAAWDLALRDRPWGSRYELDLPREWRIPRR